MFQSYPSIYSKYISLNESRHVYQQAGKVINILKNAILDIKGIDVDECGCLRYSDDFIQEIEKCNRTKIIDTFYNYVYDFNKNKVEFFVDRDLVVLNKAKNTIPIVPKQPADIDYLNLKAADYHRLSIFHHIFIELHYKNPAIKYTGCISRAGLVTSEKYKDMTDKQRISYIKGLMYDPIIISINLDNIHSIDILYSSIEHELSHLFLLCDPKRRTIEENDLEDTSRLAPYLNFSSNKENVQQRVQTYNVVLYYLMKDERNARINSIWTILKRKFQYIKNNLNKDFSDKESVEYLYNYISSIVGQDYLINKKIYDLLYLCRSNNLKYDLSKKYKSESERFKMLYNIMSFKFIYILNNRKDVTSLNLCDDLLIYYISNPIKDQKTYDDLLEINTKIFSVTEKYINKLYNNYKDYVRRIKDFLLYFYKEVLYNDSFAELVKKEDDTIEADKIIKKLFIE